MTTRTGLLAGFATDEEGEMWPYEVFLIRVEAE